MNSWLNFKTLMNANNEINPLSETLKKKLNEEKTLFIAARSAKLQEGIAEKILKKIKEHYKLDSIDEALAVLAILFQQGGTARSCDGNMSITLFGKLFKLADIRKIMKQESCAKSERKLARTLADRIQEVALILEIPGNLYLKIQKQDLSRSFEMSEKT
jgi:hypothetical protein